MAFQRRAPRSEGFDWGGFPTISHKCTLVKAEALGHPFLMDGLPNAKTRQNQPKDFAFQASVSPTEGPLGRRRWTVLFCRGRSAFLAGPARDDQPQRVAVQRNWRSAAVGAPDDPDSADEVDWQSQIFKRDRHEVVGQT